MEKTVPGVYILQLEIGKQMMKDLENQALDATSQVCQILAQDPRLQDGYISVTFSKGIRFLRSVVQRCPIPVMRDIISVSARKILRDAMDQGSPDPFRNSSTYKILLRAIMQLGCRLEFPEHDAMTNTGDVQTS
uniref:Uncharacterized protein n=1 Tax=Mus musculus TaxID=10090 RepID=A0ABJ3HKM5_MOUSE